MKVSEQFAILVGMLAIIGGLSEKSLAQAPPPTPAVVTYRGECRQTVDGAVTAEGPCVVTTNTSHYGNFGEIPELAGTTDEHSSFGVNEGPRGFQDPRVKPFRKSGSKLVLADGKGAYATFSGSGTLTESALQATVTERFHGGPMNGKTRVTTYKGTFEKRLQ